MSIPLPLAHFLCGEHAWRPFPARILLLGRQTIPIEWNDILRLAAKWNLPTPIFERDETTIHARQNPDREWITDKAFFAMLGVEVVHAIDHNLDEGADIILDICQPIPDEFENKFDFIFNGSVLDNVFDTATAMRNIGRMLSFTGRVVHIETATTNQFSYSALSPSWFFDYALYNEYADAKVYMGSAKDWRGLLDGPWSMLGFDPSAEQRPNAFSINLAGELGVLVVLAEKGRTSTSDRSPIQSHYRSDADWLRYEPVIQRFRESRRPMHMGAHGEWAIVESYRGAWRSCGLW